MFVGKREVLILMMFIGASGLFLLRVFDPAQSGIFPPCPIHYLTGLYCPGCGSLRAIHALLHGEVRRAWAMNPLGMTLLPFIGYGLASEVRAQFSGRRLPEITLSPNAIRTLCIVIVVYGIVRNIPVYPFNLLAPGALLHLGSSL